MLRTILISNLNAFTKDVYRFRYASQTLFHIHSFEWPKFPVNNLNKMNCNAGFRYVLSKLIKNKFLFILLCDLNNSQGNFAFLSFLQFYTVKAWSWNSKGWIIFQRRCCMSSPSCFFYFLRWWSSDRKLVISIEMFVCLQHGKLSVLTNQWDHFLWYNFTLGAIIENKIPIRHFPAQS